MSVSCYRFKKLHPACELCLVPSPLMYVLEPVVIDFQNRIKMGLSSIGPTAESCGQI